uniref:Uncharacterized protein n=1 Tax=Lepeophtheirus salmonis TaxID=72036 RepID=A0A0K2UHZ8_LEPSM
MGNEFDTPRLWYDFWTYN